MDCVKYEVEDRMNCRPRRKSKHLCFDLTQNVFVVIAYGDFDDDDQPIQTYRLETNNWHYALKKYDEVKI